jgi:hypothetical protein
MTDVSRASAINRFAVVVRADTVEPTRGTVLSMILSQLFQQVIRRICVRGYSGPVDILAMTAFGKPLDPLLEEIFFILLLAVKDNACEIRFVPTEKNLQVRQLVNGSRKELLPFPFLKQIAGPIARTLRHILQGYFSEGDEADVEEGVIYVGAYSVELRLSSTPTEHGDLLILRIIYPEAADKAITPSGMCDVVAEEGSIFDLGNGDAPVQPARTPSAEEVMHSFRNLRSWDPTIYDTSSG